MQVTITCELCGEGDEDLQHLFRFCDMARQIWRGGSLGIHSEINGDIPFVEWLLIYIRLFIGHDGKHSPRSVYFICTLWGLWVARNNFVFRGEVATIVSVNSIIKEGMEQHNIFADSTTGNLRNLHPPEFGPSVPLGFFTAVLRDTGTEWAAVRLQVDGSWRRDSKRAGMGWYLDKEGNETEDPNGGATFGYVESALQAEANACLKGLQWVVDRNIQSIMVLSDSHQLVEMLRDTRLVDIRLLWTIKEIFSIGLRFDYCCVTKVERERVHRAHSLAKASSATMISFSNPL